MSEKKLTDMSLEELKSEKKKVIDRKEYYLELSDTMRRKLQQVRTLAYTEKKFMPPSEFRALEQKLKEYNKEVQSLQLKTGEYNSEIKRREAFIFERLFVDTCKEKLSQDKWDEIFNEVKLKMLKA